MSPYFKSKHSQKGEEKSRNVQVYINTSKNLFFPETERKKERGRREEGRGEEGERENMRILLCCPGFPETPELR